MAERMLKATAALADELRATVRQAFGHAPHKLWRIIKYSSVVDKFWICFGIEAMPGFSQRFDAILLIGGDAERTSAALLDYLDIPR
jgi:hypothetical protein